MVKLQPDLLCIDITEEQWDAGEFVDLPPEYQLGLIPLANQSDIVIVPIGESQYPVEYVLSGWRATLIGWLREWLGKLQRRAPGISYLRRLPA